MSTIAVVVAVGTGSAYAANTITSGDIVDGEITTTDVRDDTQGFGGLFAQDLAAGSVGASEVQDDSLGPADVREESLDFKNTLVSSDIGTGAVGTDEVQNNSLGGVDINESSLVGLEDVCPPGTTLFLPVCAGSDGGNRTWVNAVVYCRQLGLRVPSLGEATALASLYDVPGVADGEAFWTDEVIGLSTAYDTAETGGFGQISFSSNRRTVCVTPPSTLYQ